MVNTNPNKNYNNIIITFKLRLINLLKFDRKLKINIKNLLLLNIFLLYKVKKIIEMYRYIFFIKNLISND